MKAFSGDTIYKRQVHKNIENKTKRYSARSEENETKFKAGLEKESFRIKLKAIQLNMCTFYFLSFEIYDTIQS